MDTLLCSRVLRDLGRSFLFLQSFPIDGSFISSGAEPWKGAQYFPDPFRTFLPLLSSPPKPLK